MKVWQQTKKQNRKSPSEETIKALGNSIDECWNELNNLPQKEFPPVQVGEIISSTWNNASGKESETIQPVGEVIQEQPCDDLDSILGKSINQSMKEAKNKPVPTILWGDDGNGNDEAVSAEVYFKGQQVACLVRAS